MAKRPDALHRDLLARMEQCQTAESLNDEVIIPFVAALEKVCAARGYVLNIFGETANLAVSDEEAAPVIYDLIDEYLDSRAADDQDEEG
ncbi:hypothetical protein C882_0914 [Caenispirillum salinarum AK4]|uniref:Uncharacterized protein n=1 Tax=Caenispirillum salinarum AK4 TaxID=1238182 RepID=K9GU73_9PROT|nr:hypothetical protein [Caenispirillum salinarum]EKV28702.1 hypothetical protein C882_0914 [Caenispirillum salinarum AK4]